MISETKESVVTISAIYISFGRKDDTKHYSMEYSDDFSRSIKLPNILLCSIKSVPPYGNTFQSFADKEFSEVDYVLLQTPWDCAACPRLLFSWDTQ